MANHTPRTNQPRHNAGRFVKDPAIADRDVAAAELRKQGKTYQEIADALGYTNKGSAHHAVMRCMAEIRKDAGERMIAVEREELERLYAEAMDILERDHIHVSNGRVVYGDDGQPVLDDGPKLTAISTMRQIRESYRKLLGLDQPAKQEISGGVKYEILGVSPEDLS
jgi:DNA transposition AAA+ family ATPase